MAKLLAATIVLAALSTIPAMAADNAAGARCLAKCRADLERRGLMSKYPRGYCRRTCDYFVGAPAGVHR
jgi:hypothetical protein